VTALLVLAIATPAVADEVLPTDEPVPAAAAEPETYSLHIQGTYTTQGHPRFSSAIPDGPQSMKAQMQMAETADVTLFLGLRLGDLELYLDPEADQGFGPSNTVRRACSAAMFWGWAASIRPSRPAPTSWAALRTPTM